MCSLKEALLAKGIWESELNEMLDNVGEDGSCNIEKIYDTAWELGDEYIDDLPDKLDETLYQFLAPKKEELGEFIANELDEFLPLSSGRIIQFEI